MKAKIVLIMAIAIIAISCRSTKNVVKPEVLTKINTLIENDTINIESEWAYPINAALINRIGLLPAGSGAGNINLVGTPNSFKKIADSLYIDLPYFGERQMGGGYNDSPGIKFEGKPDKIVHSFDNEKGVHQYNIDARNKTESFQFQVNIYPNLKAEIRVNSTHRSNISYTGKIVER
jgi:hypothetical protein